jgi:very-short-patch-repair endonuclease
MPSRKNIEYLHELASRKGGKCLSLEYIGIHTNYQWRCARGHIWTTSASNIRHGWWCSECSGNKKHDLKWLHELASFKGGRCLSTEYVNNKTKYLWQCSEGHVWESKANVIQQGCWCPVCGGHIKGNLEYLIKLANKNNGKCLSTEFIKTNHYYDWQCSEGHKFKSKANCVQQGNWCPTCFHKHSKAELEIYDFVKQLYLDVVNGKRGLLKSGKLELDIYIPSLKKAIEFDGEYWHKSEWALEHGSQERDLRKSQECQESGIELLRISEEEYGADKKATLNKIKDFLAI